MRLKFATSLAVIIALLIPISTYAAGPKPGAKCTKAGLSQISNGKKYTCIKSGKSYVWNKGVVVPNPKPTPSSTPKTSEISESNIIKAGDQCTSADRGAIKSTSAGNFTCKHDGIGAYRWFTAEASTNPNPTPSATPSATIENIDWGLTFNTDDGYKTPFNSWRDYEDSIPSEWRDMQKAHMEATGVSGIYHLGKYSLGSSRPNSQLNFDNTSSEMCKISDPVNARNNRGFTNNYDAGRKAYVDARKFPGPNMKIQLVPIFSDDTAQPKNTPTQDYGRYLNFISEWAEYSSNGKATISVNIPDSYIRFNGQVTSYKIFHENNQDNIEHQRFNRDVITQVDSKIDFSGVDLVYIVAPAGTPLVNLNQGVLGEMITAEGKVKVGIVQYSYTFVNINSIKHSNFLTPYWWLHETYHGTFGLDDHYGDASRKIIGLGGWSLMSTWGGDMTAWEKWILGFITDSQVNCLAKDSNSVTWLAPSSVKTSEKKISIIYLSKYKAVVIESIRAAGLYYKLPKSSQGVLVYELDLENVGHGEGLTLVLPTNRNPDRGPFAYGEATLRVGESVVTNGQKITVLESGNFGDVVKVEKA